MYRLAILVALIGAAVGSLFAAAPADAAPAPDGGGALKPVQVFDVARGKVVKTIDNDDEFQTYARDWLRSVTGVSPKAQPDDKCGYVFRVPLREPVKVQSATLSLTAGEVFLFYCPGEPPRLLVIDPSRKAYFLELKTELGPFLQKTGVPTL